jgi:hypothetical protein
MPIAIARQKLLYSFNLIDIQDIDYEVFLESDTPEEIILAILGGMHGKPAKTVVTEILTKLNTLSLRGIKIDKHLAQLKVISNLRNLQPLTFKLIKKMPFKYDLESDVAFIEGREIGEAHGALLGEARGTLLGETRATHKFVKQMLRKEKYTIQEIADNAEVSIAFVEQIQKEIAEENL